MLKQVLFSTPVGLAALIALASAIRPESVVASSATLKECELASAWVTAHRDALPKTLPEFSRFSLTYRRAIYAALPVEIRKDLWGAHLNSFLAPGTTLTVEQQALLREALTQLDELLTSKPARDRMEPRLIETLGMPLARGIIATLGPSDRPALLESAVLSTGSDLTGRVVLAELSGSPSKRSEQCECSASGTNYCWIYHCRQPRDQCVPTPTGCGDFWGEPCDGVCNG